MLTIRISKYYRIPVCHKTINDICRDISTLVRYEAIRGSIYEFEHRVGIFVKANLVKVLGFEFCFPTRTFRTFTINLVRKQRQVTRESCSLWQLRYVYRNWKTEFGFGKIVREFCMPSDTISSPDLNAENKLSRISRFLDFFSVLDFYADACCGFILSAHSRNH